MCRPLTPASLASAPQRALACALRTPEGDSDLRDLLGVLEHEGHPVQHVLKRGGVAVGEHVADQLAQQRPVTRPRLD